jgi:hypothetical protein
MSGVVAAGCTTLLASSDTNRNHTIMIDGSLTIIGIPAIGVALATRYLHYSLQISLINTQVRITPTKSFT